MNEDENTPIGLMVVRSTAYVTPPAAWHRAPYFEMGDDQRAGGDRHVFATRDAALVERALAAEGYDAQFTVSTSPGTLGGIRHRSAHCLITALDPVGGTGGQR